LVEEEYQDREEDQQIALQTRRDASWDLHRRERTQDGDTQDRERMSLHHAKQQQAACDYFGDTRHGSEEPW
jgi:hypothetical protein